MNIILHFYKDELGHFKQMLGLRTRKANKYLQEGPGEAHSEGEPVGPSSVRGGRGEVSSLLKAAFSLILKGQQRGREVSGL